MVVRVDRRVASEGSAGELAAPIGDHFVDVHVELSAAARHPYVQGKHVLVLTRQDLVTGLNDQPAALIVEPLAEVVRDGGGLLQNRVCRDHLAGNQVFADAEMLKRPLGLSAPQLVGRNPDLAEAVGFDANVAHDPLRVLLCRVEAVDGRPA